MTYPPGQVSDLQLVNVDHKSKNVTLKWTATGRQLDDGKGMRKITMHLRERVKTFNILKQLIIFTCF